MNTEEGNWYLFHTNDGTNWYRVGGPFTDQRAMELKRIQAQASFMEVHNPFMYAGIKFNVGQRIPISIIGNSQQISNGKAELIYE